MANCNHKVVLINFQLRFNYNKFELFWFNLNVYLWYYTLFGPHNLNTALTTWRAYKWLMSIVRAMYRYLHCVLNGEPYYDVNPRTALEIRDNISHMLSMIEDYNYVTNLQPHLFSLTHPPRTRWRSYSRQPCMVSSSVLCRIGKDVK